MLLFVDIARLKWCAYVSCRKHELQINGNCKSQELLFYTDVLVVEKALS